METDLLRLKNNLSKTVCKLSDKPYYRQDDIFDLAKLAVPEPLFYAMVRLLSIGEIQDEYSDE